MRCAATNQHSLHSNKVVLYYITIVCLFELQLLLVTGKVHRSHISEPQCNHGISCFVQSTVTSPSRILTNNRLLATNVATKSNQISSGSKPFHTSNAASLHVSTSSSVPELYSVDVRYNSRSALSYDPSTGRYLDVITSELSPSSKDEDNRKINVISRFLLSAFVPEGVTPSYYRFMRWRILQRFVNANVHVIGTQSLLMGLRGMHRGGEGIGVGAVATGAAAATNWVLKDTLGKIVRMGKYGRSLCVYVMHSNGSMHLIN